MRIRGGLTLVEMIEIEEPVVFCSARDEQYASSRSRRI
jgi:hypothetical protein